MKTGIQKLCMSICVLCLVAGLVLTLLSVWEVIADSKLLWKIVTTLIVLFFVSGIAYTLSSQTPSDVGSPKNESN